MPRGQTANVGDTMINANGYHCTRLANGWELTHRLIAAGKLGRPLGTDEFVTFKDGDKSNLDPGNIEVRKRNQGSLLKRKANLEARIEELQAQLARVEKELGG